MNTYFFDKTLTVRREKVKSGDRTAFSATSTAWDLSLQPIGDERIQVVDGIVGRTYYLYTDVACEMTEGDQAVVDTKVYSIRSVATFDFGGLEHKRYIGVQKTGDV